MPTRQDFEAMARLIRDSDVFDPIESRRAQFAAEVADLFATQNPRFNRRRFIEACRPGWVVGTKAEVHYDRVMEA